jgi:hypothetical protein
VDQGRVQTATMSDVRSAPGAHFQTPIHISSLDAKLETAFALRQKLCTKSSALMPRYVVRKVANIIQTKLRHET